MNDTQSDGYTIHALADTEDLAPKYGLDEQGETRFATKDLAAEQTGVSLQRLHPGKRPDGLELLAFGPLHRGDGEVLQGWWSD